MEQVESESLTDGVRKQLRQAIVFGELAPGSLHSIYKLAEQLGVSRSPVREALVMLSEQGMVRFERNRGVRIMETSLHDLEEILSLRLLLEVPATHRAASRIDAETMTELRRLLGLMEMAAASGDGPGMLGHDRELHRLIIASSGNTRLARFVDDLRDLVSVRGVSTAGRSRTLENIVDEHRIILDAIEAKDADKASQLMLDHLMNTARLLLSQEVETDPSSIILSWATYVSDIGRGQTPVE